jgi:hypothetical protein
LGCIHFKNLVRVKSLHYITNAKVKALFNKLPCIIECGYNRSSSGSWSPYPPPIKIGIPTTNIKKGWEGIVYKNESEYCRFTDKTIGEHTFMRTVGNKIGASKNVNKRIVLQ